MQPPTNLQQAGTEPSGVPKFLDVGGGLRIPRDEFTLTFSRSGGPGGQNVNKVSSKARLRWPVVASPSLRDDVRDRFVARNRSRITAGGDFVIASQRYRDQSRNVADCEEKLRALLAAALVPPKPRKRTRPTKAAGRRRLAAKRRRAETKQLRRAPKAQE
jgi:ribosome-associated protein